MNTEAEKVASSATTHDQQGVRSETRKQASWVGQIELHNGAELPCVVKDVSKSGAKLVVPSSFALSKYFSLKVDERNLIMEVYVVWRRGNFVGIQIESVKRIPGRPKWSPLEDTI